MTIKGSKTAKITAKHCKNKLKIKKNDDIEIIERDNKIEFLFISTITKLKLGNDIQRDTELSSQINRISLIFLKDVKKLNKCTSYYLVKAFAVEFGCCEFGWIFWLVLVGIGERIIVLHIIEVIGLGELVPLGVVAHVERRVIVARAVEKSEIG